MKLSLKPLPEPWCRLPLLTVGVAALWLLSAMTVELGFGHRLRDAEHGLLTAAGFGLQHPAVAIEPRILPVAHSLMPGFENNEMFDFLRRRQGQPSEEQDQFDVLSAQALLAVDTHPYRVLGVVPADLSPHTLLTHAGLHSGVVHALVCLLLLLVTAPLLERLWGRAVLAGVLTTVCVLSASAYVLIHPGMDRALIGGSAIVAACVAAVAMRFRAREVDLLGWLAPITAAELSVPAIAVIPLWLVGEGLIAWRVPGALTGLDNHVGWVSHAVGALLGAGVAVGAQRLGWEERFGTPASDVVSARREPRLELDALRALHATGESDAARHALETLVARRPGHRDAVMLSFAWAVADGEPDRAAEPVVELIGHELRRGADEIGLAHWVELAGHVTELPVVSDTWLRLAAVAQGLGQDEVLVTLVQSLAAAEPSALDLARAARLVEEADAQLALTIARTALNEPELPGGRRTELESLVARFDGPAGEETSLDREAKAETKAELPPNVFYEQSDRSAFGAADDLSSVDDFPRGMTTDAVPISIGDEAIRVEAAEQGRFDVPWMRVRGVSMVGVKGLGPKPIVLVDLLLDGGGMERPLSLLRLRSDGFDPRAVLEAGPAQPLEALCAIVARLLEASGALALPDVEAAAGRPVRVFESLDEYTEQVLRPAAAELS